MNTYFSPRRKNIPHVTPNYGPRKSNLEIDYYRHTYGFPEKLAHIQGMLWKSGQEEMYSSKYFNSNYMEFVGYEICDKLFMKK